ncbi:MAG: hypothetical protein MJ223_04035 [Mycoplasmoidaceae bacterium]|nr:hypothetical protein [Mycoplasmoidaceae bacterium]
MKDKIINILYVSDLQLAKLKEIEKELLLFLVNARFDIKGVNYVLDKEKQNRMLEAENNRKRDIDKMIKQSQKMLSTQEQYDRMFRVSGDFVKLKDIDNELVGKNYYNFAGEIVSIEKKETRGSGVRHIFNIFDYADGALSCTYFIPNDPSKYKQNK